MKTSFLFLFLFVFFNNSNANYWNVDYHNSGNGWFDGWHIATNDRYHYIPSPSSDIFLNYNYSNGWWGTVSYNSATHDWSGLNSNSGDGSIGFDHNGASASHDLSIHSRIIPITGSNKSEFIFIGYNDVGSPVFRIEYASYTPGHNHFESIYWNQTQIYGWTYNQSDKIVAGNFNNATMKDELLMVSDNNHLATIFNLVPQNSPVSQVWSNNGNGSIAGWLIRWDDVYRAADLYGDNRDELICYNVGTGWCTVFKFENNNWVVVWTNNGNSSIGIGGFNMSGTDFFTSDFNNCGNEEVLFASGSTYWAAVKNLSTSVYWPDIWTNNGNGWIGGWHIGWSGDKYIAFKDKVLSVNVINGWALVNKFVWDGPPCADVEDKVSQQPVTFKNYPNPFNPKTRVSYVVKDNGVVKLTVFDISGKLIATLVNEFKATGEYTADFDGSSLSSGTYFYRLEAPGINKIEKMLLIK